MDITIAAADGLPLAATRIGSGPPLVIAGATGVKRSFYAKFAAHLSQRFTVITFDYRGIGDSPRVPARMRDWGRLDLAGVLAYAGPCRVVTHSVGGQILPLAGGHVERALLVGSQSGHWRHWKPVWRPRLALLWFVLIPLLARRTFPSHWFGLGDPLPAGVAREWARWGRHRDYLLRDQTNRDAFAGATYPVRAIHIEGDHLAPRRAVEALADWYPDAHVVDHPPLGHFAWFRDPRGWDDAVAWLAHPLPG